MNLARACPDERWRSRFIGEAQMSTKSVATKFIATASLSALIAAAALSAARRRNRASPTIRRRRPAIRSHRASRAGRRRPARSAPAAAGRRLCRQRGARHHHHRYPAHLPLLRARQRPGDPLRHRRRPRRLHLVGRQQGRAQGGVAGLVSAVRDDRAPTLSAAHDGWRSGQSARRPRHVSRQHRISHPRHQRSDHHR